MLRQLIHRLRGKLAQAGELAGVDKDQSLAYIETVPGLGYGLVIPDNPEAP
jgi:DNA-binding winged helix-turn-helix (wHTH) protein